MPDKAPASYSLGQLGTISGSSAISSYASGRDKAGISGDTCAGTSSMLTGIFSLLFSPNPRRIFVKSTVNGPPRYCTCRSHGKMH